MEEKFLKIKEVADLLGMSHLTVRRLISDGELKSLKIQNRVRVSYRISESDLNEFIASHSQEGPRCQSCHR